MRGIQFCLYVEDGEECCLLCVMAIRAVYDYKNDGQLLVVMYTLHDRIPMHNSIGVGVICTCAIRHPEVKWAQRQDKVYITVLLPDSKNAKVNLDPEGGFTFSASAGAENHLYELKLDLFDKVNVEESKINIGVRSIICVLEKADHKWWKKLLRGDGKPPHYLKVDWDKW
ncbi:unnamed protein product [Thlaspi arvense]|uniref:Co-chaperone protein p23 n=1 Tax=Thlaspi arvense TaxID=13288 RepID=A0AAU9RHT6_THLAR|nr:unnamed protein product [Thlaspi arvense]